MVGKIYISGLIGSILNESGEIEKGVELVDIISQVNSQKEAESFDVYINSMGGVVQTGFDIYNYLTSLGKPVKTIGENMVASIATVIFMAGTNRELRKGTQFMVHLPSGAVRGNSNEIEEYSNYIKKAEKDIIKFYKKTTGLNDEALTPLLRNETFLDETQAFELGFSNTQPVDVEPVAYFTNNINKEMELSKDDKSWLEKQFEAIQNAFKPKTTCLVMQDANGIEITFPEIEQGQKIAKGAKAQIEGKDADGEYVTPEGDTYVFTSGELTDIKEGEEQEDELQAVTAEKEALEAEVANLKQELSETNAKYTDIEKQVQEFKAQITSKFDLDGKKEPKKEEPKNTKRTLLKQE